MKYVLDVNMGLKWVLNEVDSAKAPRLRDDYRNQVHELITPDCFPLEAAHALARAERRRLIADASQFWGEIMADSPLLVAFLLFAHRALSISQQARIGFYNCLYVALAEQEGASWSPPTRGSLRASSRRSPSSSTWHRCLDRRIFRTNCHATLVAPNPMKMAA